MTLTEVSFNIRKFAPFAMLGFLVLLIFYFIIKVLFLWSSSSQDAGVFFDPVFGKIKKPVITAAKPSSGLNFKIDTVEGKPVTATESAHVFFVPASSARFGYRERIYLIAKTFGFDTEVVKHKLDGKVATFDDGKQSLEVDITNLNFTYEYKFENDPQVFAEAVVPQKSDSENFAIEFLKTVGRYPEELAQGKTNTVFILYTPELKQMKLLQTSASANMAEVDFYRPDQAAYPIVPAKYFNSQNYVMMVLNRNDYKVIKAQIKFFEKSDSQLGVYPVKTGDVAWEDLKKGKGWVVQNESADQDITIKKMFLGYYDPDAYQEYFQPVYVFLGDNNFVAYVPAVTEEYLAD